MIPEDTPSHMETTNLHVASSLRWATSGASAMPARISILQVNEVVVARLSE